MKCLSQRHNNTLPSSRTKPKADNLAIANLHSYPLSCTTASWDDSIKCLSQGHNSTLCLVWVLTIKLTKTIWHSKRLSYTSTQISINKPQLLVQVESLSYSQELFVSTYHCCKKKIKIDLFLYSIPHETCMLKA